MTGMFHPKYQDKMDNKSLPKMEVHTFEYIHADYNWSVKAPNQIIEHNRTKTQMMILLPKISEPLNIPIDN